MLGVASRYLSICGPGHGFLCSIPGTEVSLTGLDPPSWRRVWHMLFCSPQGPPWSAWPSKDDRERPHKWPAPSVPSDASHLLPWIHVNPGTICIFNKGTVFKTLALQIGHLGHDLVYLQKVSYVVIWLSTPENVKNIYKPALPVSYVDSIYPRHPSPWSTRSTQFPINLSHLFLLASLVFTSIFICPKARGFFFHIPYHTPTTPTNVTSRTPKLRKAKMSFHYTAEIKVSL